MVVVVPGPPPQLGIKWKFPLKTGRNAGPNALLGVELAELLSKFSPHKDGLVRYKVRGWVGGWVRA